jgi:hypothetical protein
VHARGDGRLGGVTGRSDRRGGVSRVGSLITGSGAVPQKKILPIQRFLGLKTRCSENVKHLVQKLSSRDLHESGHPTQREKRRGVAPKVHNRVLLSSF